MDNISKIRKLEDLLTRFQQLLLEVKYKYDSEEYEKELYKLIDESNRYFNPLEEL